MLPLPLLTLAPPIVFLPSFSLCTTTHLFNLTLSLTLSLPLSLSLSHSLSHTLCLTLSLFFFSFLFSFKLNTHTQTYVCTHSNTLVRTYAHTHTFTPYAFDLGRRETFIRYLHQRYSKWVCVWIAACTHSVEKKIWSDQLIFNMGSLAVRLGVSHFRQLSLYV